MCVWVEWNITTNADLAVLCYCGKWKLLSLQIPEMVVVIDFVAGGSLEERLKKGAFSEEVICHYSRQLLSGICYLHRVGVAHRDLKGTWVLF